MAKKWYVLHTYSGYENRVKETLKTRIQVLGLENSIFKIEIPTMTVSEIKEGSSKPVDVEKKTFPGYVLIKMELDDRSWSAVRNTPGVTGFVGSQGTPSPLTREEYNKIMRKSSPEAPKRTSTTLEVGDAVKIVSGVLVEHEGIVSAVLPEACKVTVTINIFGRDQPIDFSFDEIAKI